MTPASSSQTPPPASSTPWLEMVLDCCQLSRMPLLASRMMSLRCGLWLSSSASAHPARLK